MVANSVWLYGRRYREFIDRTPAAYKAYSMANERLVSLYPDFNVVLLTQASASSYWNRRGEGKVYALLTDHTNALSKKSPHYGFDPPEASVHPCWHGIERRIFAEQDHIFVMGSYVKSSIVSDYGICADKVTVVGAGPNLDVDVERDGVAKDFGKKEVLFVGSDGPRKGIDVLRKAVAEVAQVHPDVRVHVVGFTGESSERIEYHGNVHGEPLKQLFYSATILVLPTFREPFGIVLLEAMFSKAVCIGTAVGAIPEIIEDGRTGFIIPPNDERTLADRIIQLLSDPVRSAAFAERAYERARLLWTWDRVTDKMVERLDPEQGDVWARTELAEIPVGSAR
jgi:glycosyltransferase involved in cell wall biosynthesis